MAEAHLLTQRLAARLRGVHEEPVSRVIVDDVWLGVVEGTLEIGERLPTAREMAVELGISPRVVERAYAELAERGVVASRPGEGAFISLQPPPEAEHARHRRFADLCRETFDQARELGFTVDDLIDSLAEFRSADPPSDGEHLP